jgi:nitrogen regulatory protein PII 2
MKEVMAVIRMNRMNKTKRALSDAGIPSITVKDALGRGKGLVDFGVLKGAELGYEEAISQLGQSHRLIPKRLISITLPENLVQRAVDTIIETNRTGKSGDGKIFVMPVMDVIRVRTEETGESALDEA